MSNFEGQAPFYRGILTSCKKPSIVNEEILCQSISLDAVFKNLDVFCLKIDTDGHNTEVLQGALETLKRTRWVIIEDEDDFCLDLFFKGWRKIPLPSGCDWLLLNPNSKKPIH